MMWRLPVNAAQSSEYVSCPWKCPTSDEEICGALTAQYRSTYRCDFMGMPQGRTSLYFQSCAYESVSEQLNRWHSSMQTCLDETISVVVISLPTAYFSFLMEFLWQDMIPRLAMKHSRREVASFTETETRDSNCQPKQKPELLRYSYSIDPNMACCGIGAACVPEKILM